MFDSPYPYKFITKRKGSKDEPFLFEYIYRFKCRFNHAYLIRIEEYSFNVFAVKFHLKAHSTSDNKYSLLTRLQDAPRVIATAIDVMLEIYKNNPFSSFGFVASPLLQEGSHYNTKRFRVYRRVMENLFSPMVFSHRFYEQESCYILLNRDRAINDPDLLIKIEDMFSKIYFIDLDRS